MPVPAAAAPVGTFAAIEAYTDPSPEKSVLPTMPATHIDPVLTSSAPLASAAPAPKMQTYTDPVYGFSFEYPEGFGVGAFEEYSFEGQPLWTVLVQSHTGNEWFELFVYPYEDLAPLTSERVLIDLEADGLTVHDPQDITIANDIPALGVFTEEPGFPDAYEVYFANGLTYDPNDPESRVADIYWFRTSPEFKEFILGILVTWRFE